METRHPATPEAQNSNQRRRHAARFSGLAAVVIAGLVTAGCAATPENSGGEDQTVTVWHYFSDENQVKILEDYKEIFEAAHSGVTVENVFVPYDQMTPNLLTAATTSNGPDVIVYNGGNATTLALGGALAPLDEQWASYADADQYSDAVLRSLDGTLYATGAYVNLLGLWYNQDILDEVGVEPPTSIEELSTAMDKVVAAGYQGITLTGVPNGQSEWQAFPWMTAYGFDYADPQREPLVEAFTQVQSWVSSGALSAEAVTWDQTVPFQVFAAGGVAFAENGNWQRGTAESTAEFTYGVVPLPVGEDGGVYLGGESLSIGAFADSPSLAWDYLEETYLTIEGQLIALRATGSIPARADAAETEEVTSDPLTAGFAASIAANGRSYPEPVVPAETFPDLGLEVGTVWSALIAGQVSPEEAADQVLEIVDRLL